MATNKEAMRLGFPSGDRGNWDKNSDDFRCIQISFVMSMRLSFTMIELTHESWWLFPLFGDDEILPSRGPWFPCIYAGILKSKYVDEEIV